MESIDITDLINEIDELNRETQFLIGTDEGVQNDYADGYQTAIDDIQTLLKSKLNKKGKES